LFIIGEIIGEVVSKLPVEDLSLCNWY